MSYNQFTEPGRTKLCGQPAQYFAELLKPDGAETVAAYEHKYWDRYAGITKHRYGQGCAYYIGTYVPADCLKKIYRDAAASAGIEVSEYSWPVIIRSGCTPKAGKIHYILHYSQDKETIHCPYASAVDLLTGKKYQAGDEICLKDWDVLILKEE
jgi:beta-galactosidase